MQDIHNQDEVRSSYPTVKKTWGVTLEYDTQVYADTEDEADRLAQGLHSSRMGGNAYVTGRWLIKEEVTETKTIVHGSPTSMREENDR